MSRRLLLIIAGSVVILFLSWYVALWRPAASASTRARASRATAEAVHATLESQLAGLRALQKTLPSEEAKLRQSEIAVPDSASVGSVIDQINSLALADHIAWTNESQSLGAVAAAAPTTTATTTAAAATTTATTPTTTASTGFGDTTLTLTLDVAGSLTAMSKFITDLENRPRLIVIDSLTYSAGLRAVTVTMNARAFYNSAANPTIPTAAGGA